MGERSRLQRRKEAVPTYVAGLGGSASDLPSGITLATATLQHWADVSVAKGGSDDLTTIFGSAADFVQDSVLNELIIRPISLGNSGITIDQAGYGLPFLKLMGNPYPSGTGFGLIHFEEKTAGGSDTKSVIFSRSEETDNSTSPPTTIPAQLIIDQIDGDIEISCATGELRLLTTDVNLGAATTLTRGAREVFGELTSIQAEVDAEELARAAADSAITAAQLVITNALDSRLDIAEAKSSFTDPTTQTLLDAEETGRAAADTAITAAQLVITNGIQADVDANQVVTDALRSEYDAEKVATAAARTVIQNDAASLTANDQVFSGRQVFGTGAAGVDGRLSIKSNSGSANSLLILDSKKQVDSCAIYMRHAGQNCFSMGLTEDSAFEIYNRQTGVATLNLPIAGGLVEVDGDVDITGNFKTNGTAVVSYTGAAQVATNTSDIAGKASLSTNDQVYSGRQIFGTGAAGVDGRLSIKSNSGSANSLLIIDSKKQASSCLIYLRHGGSNKFTMGLNADSDLEIYNRATGASQITLPIGGGVLLPNLPTASSGLATGQLWNDSGTLKIA